MASQARRGTQGHGRSARAGSWSVVAAASAGGAGSIESRTPSRPVDPAQRPATKATYRTLLLRGLTPDEAASLTAFLCGIQVGSGRWHIDEVNQLLFLRELQIAGRFGSDDGAAAA
jgi:hypothetical protein